MTNTDTQTLNAPSELTSLTGRLREQILEAQTLLEAGDIRGAEALSKTALQQIKALEAQIKLEESQRPAQKKGVTYDADDIARARAELTRRFDRLAKTLRKDEMG